MDIMFQSCGKFAFWKQLKVDPGQHSKDSEDDWHPIAHRGSTFRTPYKAVLLLIAMLCGLPVWRAVLQGAELAKHDRRSNQVLVRADAAGSTRT